MVKRITYLTRRADLTSAQFSAHWSTTHADIARDLPGVVAYRQNHIVWYEDEARTRFFDTDGVVELWFEDAESAAAGFGSDVADRLIVDERNFLSGLTGSAVVAPAPADGRLGKLWLLWAVSDRDHGGFDAAITKFAARTEADSVQINLLAEDAPILWRAGLRRQKLPAVAVALSYDTVAAARMAADAVRLCVATLGRPQRAVAEEVRII